MVAIKDMEMPSCCGLCERYLRTCEYRFENAQTKRHPDCPLVEIEERKQGEWILHEENSASSSYHCSVCNRLINVLWSEELSDYPFCHCGAEMRGEENG